ncbi:MAG: stage V sporulation protein S [Candidatus Lokiarchaeota archaeon]|nr:stage V sporulation protein S [Candidatus Lokiarchaeota archaeon]
MNKSEFLIKVAGKSPVSSVAGSVAHAIREGRPTTLQSIGATAVNQSVKAVAVARKYLEQDAIDVACFPYFVELIIDGEERTALRLEIRRLDPALGTLTEF